MASGATFHAKITADAREFIAQVEGAQEALKNLIQETKGAGKTGTSGQASKASKAKKEQKTAQQQAQQAANDLHQKELRNIKKESEERKKAAKEEAAYLKRERQIAQSAFRDLEAERRNRRQISVREEDIRGQRAEGPVRDVTDLTRLQKQYTRVVRQEEEHQRKIAVYNRQQLDAMVTGRYALYDMANAYQQIAYNAFRVAQAVGFAVANTAKFESAFTAVERAAMLDNTTESFEYFRQSLIELSTQLPITFEEISNIATLGAQMGVATGNLEQFTRTIAAFSSITGASIDETAERFGRISALAKVPVDEFENLASSVLFAGFNAVATEQEILSMSESIAAAASNAGYSAKQVIGLATALSSLGIAPEQARGVILRVFNTITRAIEGSTDKLGAFADAAGMSAEQAQYLWKESPEQFFTALLNGLGTVEELTLALDELGITNTREINVIQRLSGNMDVYSQSLKEASQAYEEGTALQDIYSKTADNLETKVVQLQNAFTALQAAAGEGLAAALKPAVDFLVQLTRAATQFADSGLGRVILPLVGTVAALAAGFAGIQFVSKIATAQLLAMRVAILKTGQAGLGGINIFRGLIDALRGNVYATTELGGRLEFLTKKQIESRVASNLWSQETANMIINSGRASKGVAALSAAMSGLGIAITAASIIGIGAMIYNMNKMRDAVGSNVGGVKALAEAIGRDTEAFNQGGEAIATHTIEVQKNADSIKNNADNSNIIIDAQGNIAEQFETTTGAIVEQTAALGENFKQLLLQDIQESDALENLFENLKNQGTEINDLFGAMGLTIADFVDAAAVDPEAGAFNLLAEGLQNLEANIDNLDEKSQVLARDLLRIAAVDGNLQQNDIQAFISGLGGNVEDLLRLISDAELGIANSSVYIAQDLGKIVRSVQDGVSASLDQYEILKALGLQFNETTNSLENWNEEQEEGEKTADGLSSALRTVLDYASDLSGIFDRIVGIEFGTTEAEDDIADAWEKIGERADKAREAIEDANNEIKELTADRAVLEYQLSVAERYGDERRAMQIRAKLGQVDAKLADESEKLADAQDEVSMTLEGQTEAARDNRDAVDDLVGSYMDLIQAAVESGLQGEELEQYIESLKEEFYANGEAVGFSRTELEKYGALFDQFKTAVQQVDPRIDIEFNTNLSAVQNALNEFEASLNRIDGKNTDSKHTHVTEDVQIVRTPVYQLKVNGSDVRLFRLGLERGALSYVDYIKMVYGVTAKAPPGVGGSFLLKASGGLISGPGTSTSDSIPTMLSNGEYVIQAKAVQSYGVDFMNAINQQRVPMAASAPAAAAVSGGSTIAYLAPEDRALLRAVADRPVTLYADNTKIAQSANAGNQTLSQRGLK